MRRREFVELLGGAAAWPLAARAQQSARLPTIGFLGVTTASAQREWTDAFMQRLHELGWIEGRTIAVEYRWAEGRTDRFTEFVRLKVVSLLPRELAAKQTTSVIPIVFAAAGNPVGNGLVESLARPGGNVTGLSSQASDTVGKRIELLHEIIPNLRRLAILGNADSTYAVLEMGEVQAAARTLGLEVARYEIRRGQDIAPAFDALKGQVDAIYIATDPLAFTQRIRIHTLALAARLPTAGAFRDFVETGSLMSYGSNLANLYRHAADYADKILRGAKPGELPVEQPTKFDLVINLTTAKALGLVVPESVLLRADELID